MFCQICALWTNSLSINRQNCMSKTLKFLKVYLNKPSTWMSKVWIFSQCFLRSTSNYPYYSCLISINPTQDFMELLFHTFAFFIITFWIGIWICLSWNVTNPSLSPTKTLNLFMKTNTKIQCFSDSNRNVFAKTAEKKFEFYHEMTFNMGKEGENVSDQPILPG